MTDIEKNEKIAKWCGFTHQPYKKTGIVKKKDDCWIEPGHLTQHSGYWSFNPPDFLHSMDACIKWIVPAELIEEIEQCRKFDEATLTLPIVISQKKWQKLKQKYQKEG